MSMPSHQTKKPLLSAGERSARRGSANLSRGTESGAGTTQVVTSSSRMRLAVQAAKTSGKTIGFVPTMGALHRGHLSLVEASLSQCDQTVVSIFVNPTQFGPDEDVGRYPRTLDRDLRLLEELCCPWVFAPSASEMYGAQFDTSIDVGPVAEPFEGAMRPTHFQGVATVVLKLFQIVPANHAYFGQKDYQQSLVVKQLARDLSVPIDIHVQKIVREEDGLACSSRNAFLSPAERVRARSLWQSLQLAEQMVAAGEKSADKIIGQMREQLARCENVEV